MGRRERASGLKLLEVGRPLARPFPPTPPAQSDRQRAPTAILGPITSQPTTHTPTHNHPMSRHWVLGRASRSVVDLLPLSSPAGGSSSASSSSFVSLRPLTRRTLASTALFPHRPPSPALLSRQLGPLLTFPSSRSSSSAFSSSPLGRGYSQQPRQQPHDRSDPRPPHDADADADGHPHQHQHQHQQPTAKVPLTQRVKALSKKYGWWAIGVYGALSVVDFALAFGLVSYLGMARVQRLEQAVKRWVAERTGWTWGGELDSPAAGAEATVSGELKEVAREGEKELKKKGYDSAFWAQVAIVSLHPPPLSPPARPPKVVGRSD